MFLLLHLSKTAKTISFIFVNYPNHKCVNRKKRIMQKYHDKQLYLCTTATSRTLTCYTEMQGDYKMKSNK